MEKRRSTLTGNMRFNGLGLFTSLFILFTRVSCNQVTVPEKINAVLGKNITLSCRIEVGSNLSLTQSSWERRLPSGPITLAVFNPEYGISVTPEYSRRVSFVSPSVRDATITLGGVGFADIGSYTCKVATFPLGNTQASTYVNILVEPKVYVSAGAAALLDGGNESLVATCIAERGRPAAEVFWETDLRGRSDRQTQEEPNGTTTVHMRYMWVPKSDAQGKILTCVVRHPALQTEFRIPFTLNIQFAPMVSIEGILQNWYVGQEDVKLECGARANPPARHFTWIRKKQENIRDVDVEKDMHSPANCSVNGLFFKHASEGHETTVDGGSHRQQNCPDCRHMDKCGHRSLPVNHYCSTTGTVTGT